MKEKGVGCKIYDLDYLANAELTDKDVYNLFDTNSLLYSLIIGQFRLIGDKRPAKEIIKECKTNEKWVDQYKFLNKEDRESYRNEVVKIIKNVYQHKNSETKADWFMFEWGFGYKS